jgi:beta-mannosidase
MGPAAADAGSRDILNGSMWECRSNEPEDGVDTADASRDDRLWTAAAVPGTAAGALRDLGQWTWGDEDQALLDGSDWWYRCRFDAPEGLLEGPWQLDLDGLATVADVWLNDEHLLHSENMWVAHQLRVDRLEAHNMLLLRFAALAPLLARRRPRPRWRSLLLRSQNQRWYRTTLLGRVQGWAPSGAPVGPWRPVRLRRGGTEPFVAERSVHATCDGADGVVEIRLRLEGVEAGTEAELRVGDHRHAATVVDADVSTVLNATIRVPAADRWWPHTHGDQPLYRVGLTVDGIDLDLGTAGFRTVEVDRADGAFTLSLNGVPIFCRGALWVPPDAVTLDSSRTALRTSLQLLADAGMNMVRIGGYMSYESSDFWDLCDELGILVWQDCMLAGFDPPEEPEFVESVQLEVRQQLGLLTARPSLAVVCASSETQQQAAMYGLPSDGWHSPLLEETIPALAHDLVPDLPCVVSSPSGGDLPFEPGQGIAHYFGVGAYLRPLTDARAVGVRFAAECLSFGNPPEQSTVERCFGNASVAGHHPTWKAAVARDSGTSWDFEDVRDEYVRQIFGVDPFRIRYTDPERYLDYGRAVVAHIMSTVVAEWRCAQSPCAGALILSWQDISPGAGWGLLDSFTEPKAPWYALRRVLAPVAALITDEGLAGLRLHVVNDQASSVEGTLRLTLFNPGGSPVEEVESAVQVDGRGEAQWNSATLLGGFRDLTNAYRFGPPAYDVVQVRFETADAVSETFHLPAGSGRPQEPDLGLEASAAPAGDNWQLSVRARRFAQWVAIDVPGFAPGDSWFHVAPGGEHTVTLRPSVEGKPPRGRVRALNGLYSSPIVIEG